MKSIKPGRGPSMMSGYMSIAVALFGLFWTFTAAGMGAYIMIPFGLIFIAVAIMQAVYNFKNATSKNRYSSFDITDSGEEPDPMNLRFGGDEVKNENTASDSEYCPYCGTPAQKEYSYCSKCGKKLP